MTIMEDRAPEVGSRTPWGIAQVVTERAKGIVAVSTSRHGGIWLSQRRWEGLPSVFRRVPTFAGGPWYEEDIDVAMVILSYPDIFGGFSVWECLRLSRHYPLRLRDAFAAWKGARREHAEEVAQAWEDAHRDSWIREGGCTHGNGWRFTFTQVGTGDRAVRDVDDYPDALYETLPGQSAGVSRAERGA